MIKKIDLYLLDNFFKSLLVVTVALGVTFVIINLIEELRHIIDNNVPLITIFEYYFYFSGWVLKVFLPMFILLAVLFAVSMLARKNELLAMKASGLSLYRISAPILIAVLIISVMHFYYNEFIYPPWNEKRLEIKNFILKRKSKRSFEQLSNIYRQISPGHFYTMFSFNIGTGKGTQLKIYERKENKLSKITASEHVEYTDSGWVAIDGYIRNFIDSTTNPYMEFDTLRITAIEDKPNDFERWIGKPEDMGLLDLKAYIDLMKRTGSPHVRESVDLDLKFSYPLASFIVVLICIPYASNPRRGGIAVSISVGALISLIYFVLFKIMQSAGYNDKIPHFVAVWGINILFFIVGIISMWKTRK